MKILKYFNILIYLFVYLSSANAFTDKEGKGAQSTGKEDLSFLETKTSNFKKGKDAFKQALKLEKKDKKKKAKKRFNDALDYFVLAYKDSPNNSSILNYLGITSLKVEDIMMAEIYFSMGLDVDPFNPKINQHLGELHLLKNNINLAKERLQVLMNCNCNEYLSLKKAIENTK
tara:strand:- start:10 stop:528 length:519 start_codon:yes stop_codon:yes gene_type:complete